MKFVSSIIRILRNTFRELVSNDPLRMAGATAFFTTFALPPILIIIIQLLGSIFGKKSIGGQLFRQLDQMLGQESALQILETLRAFRSLAENPFITIGGFIFLLFVATTLFRVIKNSINQIWKVKVGKKKVLQTLTSRLKSVGVIVSAGLLLFIGVIAEAANVFLAGYLEKLIPEMAFYFNSVLSYIISIITVTIWFVLVFHFLPDGRAPLRTSIVGAIVTSIAFNIGKLILRWLLNYSNISTIFGTSSAIVLILLFVFYTALIFYFGAAFTKIWGEFSGRPVKPLPHAVKYRLTETDINTN